MDKRLEGLTAISSDKTGDAQSPATSPSLEMPIPLDAMSYIAETDNPNSLKFFLLRETGVPTRTPQFSPDIEVFPLEIPPILEQVAMFCSKP